MSAEQRKLIYEEIIPPGEGWAGIVKKGQHLRIIDVEGQQVGDLVFFNEHNVKECMSPGVTRSRQFLGKPDAPYKLIYKVTEGNFILSTAYRPMATIVADTPTPKGIHTLEMHMCDKTMYKHLGYPDREGCLEISSRLFAEYGIATEQIPDPLNVFMNVEHDLSGEQLIIKEPVSRPGDYIEFRAEMDLIAGFPVCPMDIGAPTNGPKPTSLKVEIYE